jgi:hypothetical protein
LRASCRSEPLLGLLICDLAGEEATCESTATLRTDLADVEQRLDDAGRTAHQLPHRDRYLMLVIVFMRQLLELHGELIDNVDRELASPQDASTRESATAR